MDKASVISKLAATLPPIFTRTEISKLTGGVISPRTLANLDSAGRGPTNILKFKRKVAYEKDAFLAWFAHHLKEGGNE